MYIYIYIHPKVGHEMALGFNFTYIPFFLSTDTMMSIEVTTVLQGHSQTFGDARA